MSNFRTTLTACYTWTVVCAITAGLSACSQKRPIGSALSQKSANELDVILFESVLREIVADPFRSPVRHSVRVDPRPVTNDPRLVTLRRVWEVIPERVSREAHSTPFAEVAPAVIAARQGVLRKMNLPQTDSSEDAKC